MRRIKLTKGKWATVDDCFYDALVAMGSWYCHGRGYACRDIFDSDGKKKTLFLHRAVMELSGITIQSGIEVDHRNGRRRDNRLRNLRLATQSQQNQNQKRRRDNSSGIKGVSWSSSRRKWQARIAIKGRQMWLGYFGSKHKASTAYRNAAKKYFGEFARAA